MGKSNEAKGQEGEETNAPDRRPGDRKATSEESGVLKPEAKKEPRTAEGAL